MGDDKMTNHSMLHRRMMGGGGHHPHYVFEPPFNKAFVAGLVWGGVGIGAGLIVYSWKVSKPSCPFANEETVAG